jgi:hypothetical protein
MVVGVIASPTDHGKTGEWDEDASTFGRFDGGCFFGSLGGLV